MKVVIIKYNAGNIQSVKIALQRLNIVPIISDDKEEILQADKVIFPGVGEASSAIKYLKENGLDTTLIKVKVPVLGICLGLQLLCSFSEENQTPCLNIFPANVKRFPPDSKVPHMGWNMIQNLKGDLFKKVNAKSYVYFVHSYYAEQSDYCIAETDYILTFASALQKDNFYAVQFHPEKSGDVGEQILRNFLNL